MNQATYISPEQGGKFVMPYITEQVRALSEKGVPVILHSDGNLNNIMDEIE